MGHISETMCDDGDQSCNKQTKTKPIDKKSENPGDLE
jgi:hypothetical protein